MMLLKDKPSLEEFLTRPLVYSPVYKYGIVELCPESMDVKVAIGEPLTFSWRSSDSMVPAKVEVLVINGSERRTEIVDLVLGSNGLWSVDYTFSSRGSYVVHLLFDQEYLATEVQAIK